MPSTSVSFAIKSGFTIGTSSFHLATELYSQPRRHPHFHLLFLNWVSLHPLLTVAFGLHRLTLSCIGLLSFTRYCFIYGVPLVLCVFVESEYYGTRLS